MNDPKTFEELSQNLEDSRAELRAALEELEGRARAEIDLGRLYREHADAVLFGAFITGVWLGLRR